MSDKVKETIDQAERDGLFLWHDSKAYSPRELRCVIEEGWTVDSVTTISPVEAIQDYEREAARYRSMAREAENEARRIRDEMIMANLPEAARGEI